jgi:peptidase M49-like protein
MSHMDEMCIYDNAMSARARRRTAPVWIALVFAAACSSPPVPPPSTPMTEQPLDAKIRRFARVDISANVQQLPDNERQALAHMIRAAELMDGLFLEQVWAGNPSMLVRLAADRSPGGQATLHYFLINKGPWSRIDHNEPFWDNWSDVPPKPPQANYYPADATKDEVAKWMASIKADAFSQSGPTGFFSVIRRSADGKLMAVPYSVEYHNILAMAAATLNRAAGLTAQPTLKKFLELRAAAFLTNDYFASDMAWMELDASIEPTIGPYETYEDEWFGYKAAFEAFITIRDDEETRKLTAFGGALQGLEDALPIDPKYRNPKLGALAPLRVVNVVFTAGDANRGVQTAAFNLPNDDRVIKEKGSKRVMLKNVQEAKFARVLVPIGGIALAAADRAKVSFEAFFTHILMHEVMHGLGPHQVTPALDVRHALKDTYASIEEAKADISGLWALQQLADKGIVSAEIAKSMYTTFLASAFRSIRFGLTEAHGKGIALQLNTLIDRGGFVVNADGTFSVNDGKIKDAVAGLTHDLMTLEAEGNYDGAKALLEKMVVIRPEVQKVLDRLKDVPVDIEPNFVTAKQIRGR